MPDILGRLRPPRLVSAPASPALGEEYYNTASNILYYWNGTTWITAAGAAGGGLPVFSASAVGDVGMVGQVRAGRQLTAADFTALGLSAPRGLWNLSDLTDASGNGRALTNKGSVPFGLGINGAASTAAVFAGSTAQALYILDTGAADPFRITTGSAGCWFRTAKRGTGGALMSKRGGASGTWSWEFNIGGTNVLTGWYSSDGSALTNFSGVSDVADDRWHFGVIVFDGAAVRVYIDAILEGTVAMTNVLFGSSTGPLVLGVEPADTTMAAAGTTPHYGRMDEAFVTADVLSDDQVRALYCAKVAHTYGATPAMFNFAVRRRRKGGTFVVGDFPAQPLRLHNFTAGGLNDEGSNNVTLTNNGTAVSVSGADGALGNAFNFVAASSQSLSSTDAGLPSGTAARSHGCWFKTTYTGNFGYIMDWGTARGTNDTGIYVAQNTGTLVSLNGADNLDSSRFVADGQWHFAVMVEDNAAGDGAKRKMYLDGRVIANSTVLNAITLGGANKFRVGSSVTPDFYFQGQLDGAFVCGYALTQDQISTLYAKGSQALAASPKNVGDHVEYADSSSVYLTTDTLDSQHTVDLSIAG